MDKKQVKVKIERKVHHLDADGQSLGRLASQIAILLRGKNKPSFVFHIDNGDSVIVSNIKKVKITGNKMTGKKYYHFSGYPGGLKTTQLWEVFEKNPGEVLRRAVYNMLPPNKLRREMIKRLKTAK